MLQNVNDWRSGFAWHTFPNADRFAVRGLHWFKDNQPLLWRLPKTGFDHLPKGVAQKALQPSGGRIFMTCNTTALSLRVMANIHLIDGVQLLGFGEHDALSKDGLHPSDYGYHLIASRLIPILRPALGL